MQTPVTITNRGTETAQRSPETAQRSPETAQRSPETAQRSPETALVTDSQQIGLTESLNDFYQILLTDHHGVVDARGAAQKKETGQTAVITSDSGQLRSDLKDVSREKLADRSNNISQIEDQRPAPAGKNGQSMADRLTALGLPPDRLTGDNPGFKHHPEGWVN